MQRHLIVVLAVAMLAAGAFQLHGGADAAECHHQHQRGTGGDHEAPGWRHCQRHQAGHQADDRYDRPGRDWPGAAAISAVLATRVNDSWFGSGGGTCTYFLRPIQNFGSR